MDQEFVTKLEETLQADRRAHDQQIQQERAFASRDIDELRKIKPPSRFWFFILAYLAILVDILDIVEAVFRIITGASSDIIGTPVAVGVALFFIAVGYFQSQDVRRLEKPSVRVTNLVHALDARIGQYRALAASAYRRGRGAGQLRRPLRAVAQRLRPITKLTRSPFRKVVFQNILQVIPFLDLWFWQFTSVHGTYKARKKAYEDAQLIIAGYLEAQNAEQGEFDQMQEATAETLIEEAQELDEAA